ncbi:MAG TPA: recombinase family protein [Candidatus Polarisedimenticolia bacterium]|jgi:DNA invertase Pin-like site-specific DNA recombinase|nr:recombinase family protein [Candidatus Polarisedimenticolia bacterium]
MKKAIAVYLRVSTTGQDVRSQEPDLRAWLRAHGRGRTVLWYRDRFTGSTLERPGMRKLEEDVRGGRIETLVVWRLDRLGRTAGQTITFLDGLGEAGVRFVSLRDGLDTSTATGRLMRTIIAGFAEYEREVISERIRAGIAQARAKGKRWGGKKRGQRHRLTKEKPAAVQDLLTAGKKKAAIARQLGVSRSSIYRGMRILGES